MSLVDAAGIALMTLGVFLPKAVPMLVVSDRLTPGVRRWLDYVAPAVLAALVAPSVVLDGGVFGAPRLQQLAFVATFVVAVWTRRMLPSVAVGVAILAALVLMG